MLLDCAQAAWGHPFLGERTFGPHFNSGLQKHVADLDVC